MIIKHKKIKAISKVSVGLLSLFMVIGGIYTLSTQQAYGAPDDSSYELVWKDEFDGTTLNEDNWDYQTGAWGASEIQACYKMNTNNVNVGGGTLKLTAQYEPGVACGSAGTRDFTSGFVQTRNKKYWTYGYVEARIKMPNNNGSTWPAFWMSPNEAVYGSWPRSGEIDIFEAKGHDSNYLAANAHWGIASGNKRQHQGNVNVNTLSANGTADWHTYAVKWQEGRLDFYIDGQHFHTVDNFRDPNATTHPGPFNVPFYIRLNLAIGGTYLTPPHNDAHNNSGNFPTTMEIDYVRVYQKSAANAETVNIPDTNLRSQINRTLTKTTGAQRADDRAITVEDMKNLNHLDLNIAASAPANEKITDLTGLEKAVNLTRIALANHNVRNITPLAGLTHLTSIDLTGNAVTDVSPLNGLTKLTSENLKLGSQKPTITTSTPTFPSPLKNQTGATITIQDSSTLANDTAGNLRLVSPVYDGQLHTAQAPWTTSITIGGATATFSGTLTVNATLPQQQPQPDLSGLRAAIAAAEAEPSYIQNDSVVAAALTQARAVVAQASPSQTDIQTATNNLNNAVAAAKQKEQNAQAAAETAVAAAENSKRPSDVASAQAKVNAVQDPAKKAAFQARLNAVNSAISSALSALNSLIATAKDPSTTAGMSSSTVAALQSQITAAEAVANNANSSVAELDNARTALQAKIDALQIDTSALQAAITAAEAEPNYIKSDTDVNNALTAAKAVLAQTNPSASAIQAAITTLNNTVAAAKQKEQDAQAAAQTAVSHAESTKRPSDVTAAQAKVNAVQDPDKKASFQNRLQSVTNAINSAKTSLSTLLDQAQGVSTSGMTSATTQALQAQITASQQVLGADSSVAELQDSRDKLQTAINNLRADKTALQAAITAAENEPAYIKNDTEVAATLQHARSVQSNTNPSVDNVRTATEQLQQAVAAAKQKEQDAQVAAEAAVVQAETDKTQTAIDAAKVLVNKVQDPAKKAALQARLNAIVVATPNPPTPPTPNPNPNPNPNPTTPTTSATIPQPHGASVTISTSGDACYNLASAKAATAPERHNNRILRDIVDFTIDCTNQTANTGFTTQVTLTLSRRYNTTRRLTIAKITNGTFKEDITSHVTFGTTSDGKYTTISYSLTDGGFGDEDGIANGVIVDPVGVYEEEDNPLSAALHGATSVLAATGDNIVFVATGAILLGGGGLWMVRRGRE